MSLLVGMDDRQLLRHVARLERDVEEFGTRAAREIATLQRGDAAAAAMHQRLASIRLFLARQLANAEGEVARRRTARGLHSRWPGDPPWRRFMWASRLVAAGLRLALTKRRMARVTL